jgi:hypothetical protein
MIYLVTEDSGSGYEFWKQLSRIAVENVTTVTCSGYNGALNIVKRLGIKPGDVVIMALDKINSDDTVFECYDKVRIFCEMMGAKKVAFIDIYCFEEILLSFRYLLDWCDYENSNREGKEIDVNVLSLVRECIYLGKEYIEQPEVYSYMRAKGLQFSEESRRERFAYYLLNRLTYGSSLSYRKGKLSQCFYLDCCFMQYPKHCGIKKNGIKTTGIQKTENVYKNSILSRKKVLQMLFG